MGVIAAFTRCPTSSGDHGRVGGEGEECRRHAGGQGRRGGYRRRSCHGHRAHISSDDRVRGRVGGSHSNRISQLRLRGGGSGSDGLVDNTRGGYRDCRSGGDPGRDGEGHTVMRKQGQLVYVRSIERLFDNKRSGLVEPYVVPRYCVGTRAVALVLYCVTQILSPNRKRASQGWYRAAAKTAKIFANLMLQGC